MFSTSKLNFLKDYRGLLFKGFILILSIVGVTLQLVVHPLFYTYQKVVIFLAKRKCMNILPPISTVLSDDEDYTENESTCCVVTVLNMEGRLSLEEVQEIFRNNVLNTKENLYPELRQYQVDYLGYRFWKPDPKFSISNHIQEQHLPIRVGGNGTNALSEVHEQMLNRKFRKGSSPWELILLQNPSNSFIVFRIHHSMSDAKSVNKLLIERFAGKQINSATIKYDNFDKDKRDLWFYILAPFYLTRLNYNVLWTYCNFWNNPWCKRGGSKDDSPFISQLTDGISLEYIKKAAKSQGYQLSAIFMAAVSSALSKFTGNYKSVQYLPVYYTLPKPGHPLRLANHLYIDFPLIPLGIDNLTSSSERIKRCQEVHSRMQNSPDKKYVELVFQIISFWTKPMRKYMASFSAVPTGISNIAGDEVGIQLNGKVCSGYSMSSGPGPSTNSIGLNFTIHSYKGKVQVAVVAKASVMKRHEIDRVTKLVQGELEAFIRKY